jgi:hypothetical protein
MAWVLYLCCVLGIGNSLFTFQDTSNPVAAHAHAHVAPAATRKLDGGAGGRLALALARRVRMFILHVLW